MRLYVCLAIVIVICYVLLVTIFLNNFFKVKFSRICMKTKLRTKISGFFLWNHSSAVTNKRERSEILWVVLHKNYLIFILSFFPLWKLHKRTSTSRFCLIFYPQKLETSTDGILTIYFSQNIVWQTISYLQGHPTCHSI